MVSLLWQWLCSRAMTKWFPSYWKMIPRERSDSQHCTSLHGKMIPKPPPFSFRMTTMRTWSQRYSHLAFSRNTANVREGILFCFFSRHTVLFILCFLCILETFPLDVHEETRREEASRGALSKETGVSSAEVFYQVAWHINPVPSYTAHSLTLL